MCKKESWESCAKVGECVNDLILYFDEPYDTKTGCIHVSTICLLEESIIAYAPQDYISIKIIGFN